MDPDVESLTAAAVFLVVYEFIIIVGYIFFSRPFAVICAAFANVNIQEVVDFVPKTEAVFMLMMAIAGVIPIVWFIFWVYKSEPDWRFVKYR